MNRSKSWPVGYLPVLCFASVYVFTCVVGAMLIILDYRPFVRLFELNTGTSVPALTNEELTINIRLLLVAPLLLALAYALALHAPGPRRPFGGAVSVARLEVPTWLPHVCFYVLVVFGLASFVRVGSFSDIRAWLDYDDFVQARLRVFDRMTFIEFVNLYIFIPTAATWVMVAGARRSGFRARVLSTLPLLVAVASSLLLFQKKPAMIALLIWLSAVALYYIRSSCIVGRGAVIGFVAIPVVYFVALVVPTYSGASRLNDRNSTPALVAYSLVAPLARTSVPALYYPVVFPHEHPFYGLDVGQDLVGLDKFPDDSIVIWRAMNPNLEGATAAPYQFVLYSQVGIWGAMLGSVIVGILLAVAWRIALAPVWPPVWMSLLGALVIVLSVYIAIDSFRNAITVSYGVGWGFLFVFLAASLTHAINAYRDQQGHRFRAGAGGRSPATTARP